MEHGEGREGEEPDGPAAYEAGQRAECPAAEDRTGLRGAKEDSKHRVRQVIRLRDRLIQKYQNFMKEL